MLCTSDAALMESHGATTDLPPDPRQWSRDDVSTWLQNSAIKYQLLEVHAEKFPMNGKGVLLLPRECMLDRVPLGGGLLYEDIHFKLQKALAQEHSHNIRDIEKLLQSSSTA